MFKQLKTALIAFALLSILLGIVYPVAMTVVAQALFPSQANGSLIMKDGKAVGSALIGQGFSDPKYFWGRPSATSPVPYTAFNAAKDTGSTGTNYGPLNPALISADPKNPGLVKAAVDALHAANQAAGVDDTALIPVDLVTASASGLDPDISPAAAKYQVPRVAKVRGLSEAVVQQLVDQYTTGRALGFLGEPHVNVLELNLALDALK